MCDVQLAFTFSSFSPVSGCTRTTGWTTGGHLVTSSRSDALPTCLVRAAMMASECSA